MAAAKKCDICGTFYDTEDSIKLDPDSRSVNGLVLVKIDKNDSWTQQRPAIDCCPKCMNTIMGLIKEMRRK